MAYILVIKISVLVTFVVQLVLFLSFPVQYHGPTPFPDFETMLEGFGDL